MQARTPRIAALALVTCVGLPLLLTGCDPLVSGEDPIAAQLNGSVFSITVCQPWTLTSVLVQTRSSKWGGQWDNVWVADGRTELLSGDVLSSVAPPDGLSISNWAKPTLEPGDSLTITLIGLNAETLDAIVQVPDSGMPSDGWLQADGTITDSAC